VVVAMMAGGWGGFGAGPVVRRRVVVRRPVRHVVEEPAVRVVRRRVVDDDLP
jgi:hypothetical protein